MDVAVRIAPGPAARAGNEMAGFKSTVAPVDLRTELADRFGGGITRAGESYEIAFGHRLVRAGRHAEGRNKGRRRISRRMLRFDVPDIVDGLAVERIRLAELSGKLGRRAGGVGQPFDEWPAVDGKENVVSGDP